MAWAVAAAGGPSHAAAQSREVGRASAAGPSAAGPSAGVPTVAVTTAAVSTAAVPIATLAAGLGSDAPAVRQRAYEALGSLPEARLEELRARLSALRSARPSPEDANDVLQAIRRATGSRRADDVVDVADGIPALLAERRDGTVRAVAEPLLLLRSLERMGTLASLSAVPEVLRLDAGIWGVEGRRLADRLGDRAAAAILRCRAHPDAAGREWARVASRGLDLEPGHLVQRLGPVALADALSVWGETHVIDAMPVVASFVDDPRAGVRAAARRAMFDYGRNAIWQAREQMRLRLGETALESWGWQRTLDELFDRLDARRREGVRRLETEARDALGRGDADAAGRALSTLLARAPEAGSPEHAALFAQAASLWLDGDLREPAARSLHRALALAPDAPERAQWEARLTFIEAEDALARGVLDLEGYRRAAAGDPGCTRCSEVLAGLERQARPAVEDPTRRAALWLAAALLAGLGVAWMRRPRTSPESPGIGVARDGGFEPDIDPADSTLPG